VLEHRPDRRVVETDLEGGRGDDHVGIGVDPGVLRRGPADADQVARPEPVPGALADIPRLAVHQPG
jgi:hypothetical protein